MDKAKPFFNFGVPISAGVFKLNDKPVRLTPKHMMIITILSGGVNLVKDGTSSNYKEGDILLIETDSLAVIKTTKTRTNLLIIGIDTQHYKDQFPHIESAVFGRPDPLIMNKMLPLLLDSAFALTEKNPTVYTVINDNIKTVLQIALDECQYFCDIITSNYSSSQTQQEYISLMQSILSYVNENYADKISLSAFAEKEHLSENYISHLIKKIAGASFKEILSFIRCKKVQQMLLDPNKRINEIAYASGFSAPSYFKKSFEKFFGVTPEKYREYINDNRINKILPPECSLLDSKTLLRDFATKNNITLSITSDRFFTIDTVYTDHYIEHFQKVLSDEGDISNIDAEMNESSHEAFINMQKEFRMSTITLDASILKDKAGTNNLLTIATNINYLIWSKFKIRFVIYSLSQSTISSIVRFMKFYSRRFNETMDEIDFSLRVNAPEDDLTIFKLNLSEKLREELGPVFNIEITPGYAQEQKYYPYLYDSILMSPFAMDELFHPENWKIGIDYSLIDAVNSDGYILAGGSGLLTWNGIKKPWWHAYSLASKLRGSVISKGPDHIITNNNGIITILTYNTCGLPATFLQSISSTKDLRDAIRNRGHVREHAFQLMNMFGKHKIITYSVNETACLFSKWADLDCPEYLTLEEETVLSQICHPEVKFSTVNGNGKIDITTREDSFGVTCVVIEKI